MAIVPSISVSQSAGTPQNVTVTDTSSGSYGTITKRRIFMSDCLGNYFTGNGVVNYDDWALANTSVTLTTLTQNTAANILVQWLDNADVVINEYNNNYPLSQFGKQFFFYLVQLQGLTPGVYQDTNYSGNLALFWANIVGGDNAVTIGNDLSGAQNCYNRATFMQLNESSFF